MTKFPSKFFSCLIFLLLISWNSIFANAGANGGQFISNVAYPNNSNNYVFCISRSVDDRIIVAGRNGLWEYSFEEWKRIETPDISLSLLKGRDNLIYTCGRNQVGYLKQNEFGKLVYYSLLDSITRGGLYTDIIEINTGLYFYSEKQILYYNYASDNLSPVKGIDSSSVMTGIFSHNNVLYVNQHKRGLFKLSGTDLIEVESQADFSNESIVFSTKFDSVSTLIGTDIGKLFLLKDEEISPYNIADEDYLANGILSDGIVFSESELALSFRNMGLLIINKHNGQTIDAIDRESGLPDDFVMQLYSESDNALWIAHLNGLSCLDFSIPIKNFSVYTGIEGSILSSNFWNDRLYLATSVGIFILDSISNFDSRDVVKKIPVIQSTQFNLPEESAVKVPDESLEEEGDGSMKVTNKERKSFFRRLFKTKEIPDKSSQEVEKAADSRISSETGDIKQEPEFEYFKYQKSILKSKYLGYSKIGDLDDRVLLLLNFNSELLAVTNTSIYSIYETRKLKEVFTGFRIKKVVVSKSNRNKIFVIDNSGIYEGINSEKGWVFDLILANNGYMNANSLAEISDHELLVSFNSQLARVNFQTTDIKYVPVKNPYSENILIKQIEESVFVLIGPEVYKLEKENMTLSKVSFGNQNKAVFSYHKQPGNLWIKTATGDYSYFGTKEISDRSVSALKIFGQISDIYVDENDNLWLINKSDEIYRLGIHDFDNYKLGLKVHLGSIETHGGKPLQLEEFHLKHNENSISFSLVSPSVIKANSNEYQYLIEGLMDDWSDWTRNNSFSIPYIPPGNYELKYRVRSVLNDISDIESISFKVSPPFWRTFYFYAIVVILLAAGIYLWQKHRIKRLLRDKQILEQKVKEHTEELRQKNLSITDSINYAGKIQNALLPPQEKLKSTLEEYFVYYKPRDIISGDFYLVAERKRYTVVIASDCTGHGVPGAFMSMLGMAYINEILASADFSVTAAEVLNNLREKIITLLHQHIDDSRDGMDMVVLLFDKQNNLLQYAGAHNPLYRLVPKERSLDEDDQKRVKAENEHYNLLEYKGNRFQVGNSKKNDLLFSNHVIDYENDEKFYIFSDGYADQFGGDQESKFKYGPFRKLILQNAHKPMSEQKAILEKTLDEWKRDQPQTDDILVFGVRP